jgi:osmotically-inducible protein OsmY
MSPTLFSDQLFTTVKPYVSPSELKTKIEQALVRSAELNAKRITVDVVGGKVTLKGTVRSWAEKQEAERQACLAPGVTALDNRSRSSTERKDRGPLFASV